MEKKALFQYSSNPYSQSVTATYCQPPFGMLLKDRSYTSDSYRFGFNGYENEPDISGNGSVIDFGARIYDSRLGKFFSVDPKTYPFWSPYQYDANCPILVKDYLGMGVDVDPPIKDGSQEGEMKHVEKEVTVSEYDGNFTFYQTFTQSENFYWHDGNSGENKGWYKTEDYVRLIASKTSLSIDEESNKISAGIAMNVSNVPDDILNEAIEMSVKRSSSSEMMRTTGGGSVRNPLWDGNGGDCYESFVFDVVTLGIGKLTISIGKGIINKASKLFVAKLSIFTLETVIITSKKAAIEVTEASIAKALEGSTMKSLQGEVSLPMVKRYVKMLESGNVAPAIKVADGVIIEGNHRYVAGRLFGVEPPIVPGTMSPSQANRIVPIQQTKVSLLDFDGH